MNGIDRKNTFLKLPTMALVILICTGCNQAILVKHPQKPLVFSVMGDIPRSDEEKIILQEQIQLHNKNSPAKFVFHVGDIKAGHTICKEENYGLVAGYLKRLNVPVFIVPGDNEWNDCSDPGQAWNYWNKYFSAFDQNWDVPFEVQRQLNYQVNISFVNSEVMFIALNLVGGRVHDQEIWDIMQQNAVDWVDLQLKTNGITAAVGLAQASPDDKHKKFMDQFIPLVKNFSRPVIFIHGDGHSWLHNDPWLVPNLVRIQVDKGGIADPLEVTVTGNKTKTFNFDRYAFKENMFYVKNY